MTELIIGFLLGSATATATAVIIVNRMNRPRIQADGFTGNGPTGTIPPPMETPNRIILMDEAHEARVAERLKKG